MTDPRERHVLIKGKVECSHLFHVMNKGLMMMIAPAQVHQAALHASLAH